MPTSESSVDITLKPIKDRETFKLRIQTTIQAEGNFTQNDPRDPLQLSGKIQEWKTGDIEFPRDHQGAEEIAIFLQKALRRPLRRPTLESPWETELMWPWKREES